MGTKWEHKVAPRTPRMGTKWEQRGIRTMGQQWELSGNKVGRRTAKWARVGTKWEESGDKNPKAG